MAEEIGAKLMTEGERQFISAMESCQRAIDEYAVSVDRAAKASAKSSSGFDTFKQSATELKAKFDLVRQAAGMIEGALDKTIGATLRYSDQIRDLSRASGASAEESSRFIQVADDLQVSFDALKMAAKSSADQGIILTVDSMAKLQEQYQTIQDPAERADFAIKAFGRSGLEMQKILEMDTEAFRNMAEGIDDSLIMTDDQVKSARELEIALDNMGDSVQGVVYQFSKALIPVLTTAAGTIEDLTEMSSGYSNILSMHEKEVRQTAKDYKDYAREMMRAKLVTEGVTNAEERAAAWVEEVGDGLEDYTVKLGFSNRATYDSTQNTNKMNQALKDTRDAAQITAAGFDEFSSSLGASSLKAADFAKILKEQDAISLKNFNEGLKEIQVNMDGAVGKAIQDYTQKHNDLALEIGTTIQKIEILKGKKPTSPEQLAELDALKLHLAETEKAAETLAAEFETSSRRMIISMLLAKYGSMENLTDLQRQSVLANIITLQTGWGLLDEATARSAQLINQTDFTEAGMTFDELTGKLGASKGAADALAGAPKDFKFTTEYVTIHTNIYTTSGNPQGIPPAGPASQGHQRGGSWLVPPGFNENYPVGPGHMASSGERIIVLPRSMSAGPITNNYSSSTNFNLSVMTSQSPSVITRSFAMMKLLSEG